MQQRQIPDTVYRGVVLQVSSLFWLQQGRHELACEAMARLLRHYQGADALQAPPATLELIPRVEYLLILAEAGSARLATVAATGLLETAQRGRSSSGNRLALAMQKWPFRRVISSARARLQRVWAGRQYGLSALRERNAPPGLLQYCKTRSEPAMLKCERSGLLSKRSWKLRLCKGIQSTIADECIR